MSAQGGSWQKDAADQNFDYMFKLLIIGNSSVGKTSFLFRYADDSFTSAFVSTVGIDFKVKTVFRQDKRVKLQIWVSFNYKISIIFTKNFAKMISRNHYFHEKEFKWTNTLFWLLFACEIFNFCFWYMSYIQSFEICWFSR